MEDMASMVRVFSAAANPQRLSIMELLVHQEKVLYSEMMKKLNLTSGNLGFHVKELMDSKLVEKKNGDSYALTDLGWKLMDWAGKVTRRQRDLLERLDYQKYRDAVSPIGKYMHHPGSNLEWLGGALVLIGVLSIILGAGVILVGILLAAGCATALGGGALNYLAGVQALRAHQEERYHTKRRA